MSRSLDFTKSNVSGQWRYVKRNLLGMGIGVVDKFESEAHKAVKDILQRGVDEEFNAKIGAKKYERTSGREGRFNLLAQHFRKFFMRGIPPKDFSGTVI